MDALSALQDEVALEGLDGITLPSLWTRLGDSKLQFPLKLDDQTKAFLWRALVHNPEISFYEQPRDREDVELYDRFENIDPDTGIEFMGHSFENRKDVYQPHIIQDNPCGIQGSCVFFTKRKDITARIRSASNTPLLSLQEAWERFGRRLVLVASQKVRFQTLIGSESDPDLKLSDESYCVLERVGRARWQGELQRDLHNGSFRIDSRKIHYLRKSLVRHNLVTVQSHVCRLSSGTQQHSCLLLLRRFHVNMRSKYDILMERVSKILEASPGQHCTALFLRQHLNVEEGSFKRLIHYMRSSKLVEHFNTPLEELDPEAGPCLNKRGNKVQVRCIRLIKPYAKKNTPDDEEEEDEERRDIRPEGRIMERDLLSQAYNMVVSSGTKGMACVAIGNKMNLGKLERRMICRQLEREGVVKGFMEDVGRQRTTKFISHKCVEVSDKLHQFVKEHQRSKLLVSSGGHPASPGLLPSATPPLTNIDVCRRPTPSKQLKKPKPGGSREPREDERPGHVTEHPPPCDEPTTEPAAAAEEDALSAPPQSEASRSSAEPVVTDVQPCVLNVRNHETSRLLRRRNLIMEAIQDLKIFEGLFPLQKIINAEEKRIGLSSKCCKKTILRLVHSLAKEGLVKLYTTTVIQDGLTRKVDLYAHPSIQSTDDIVQTIIDQIRFKMSSSYSVGRVAPENETLSGQSQNLDGTTSDTPRPRTKSHKKSVFPKATADTFKPTTVRGLSKTLGYQPKMHRLRVVHNFLWYIVYGHPLRHNPDTQAFKKAEPAPPDPPESGQEAPKGSQATEPKEGTHSPAKNMTLSEDEEETPQTQFKVYCDEDSWKRYTPPVRVHKDYSSGWVMLGDLLLCLPLSIYTQVIQINYKVEGLEEYLNDPEKQHYLVRFLPPAIKRQLLYKRRYVFYFYENLQKLCYMGLIQFAPQEKFRDKDQVFFFLKRRASIVDTTSSEPHYWLVSEPPEQPFDRRHYTFNTAEDIENFWFDLMCVCLNTPLGVIRSKRGGGDTQPSFVRERSVFVGMAYLIKGNLEVVDDGSIPGDGKGAGGLSSEFFAHLKRNWLWTNHLLAVKSRQSGMEAPNTKVRLKSLCRNSLQLVLQAEKSAKPSYVTQKKTLITIDDVQVVEVPASRNQQVMGGKQQKRKRSKKEVAKAPRKKKEPKKRVQAHDERDHEALKHMTRQRVYWTPQEDSLLMLCAVATHLFNSKLKRPFVPYIVVRDVLHKEFETSRDKTSLAVGRRTRNILKNPQTMLNYRICVAEVGQDKPLLQLLENHKPKDPEEPELCSKSFSEYVRLLRQKFSSTMEPTNLRIPDSKDQLFSQFKISAIDSGKKLSYVDQVTSTEDIHAIVLHNLIQSTLAMTNSQMKSSRSFQTFHIYSGYSQELLCQVFVQSRKRGLVNRRRITQGLGPKMNRALPILPMSYQLSQCYYRCFSWRFPQVLCTDAFRFIRNLLNVPRGGGHPFIYLHQENENRALDGEVLESRKTSQDKTAQEKSQRSQSGCEKMEGDPPDVSDMLLFSLGSPGGACVATLSLMSLGLVSVYLSIPRQMVVVDSTLVDSDTVKSIMDEEEEDEEDAEESKRMEVKAHHASHTKYLMMKGFCAPGIVKLRNLNTTDNIVVESCIMKFQLRDSPAHGLFCLDSEPALDLWKCGPSLVPAALTHSLSTPVLSADECWARLGEHRGYSPQDLQACAVIWEALDLAGERGMDTGQFWKRHTQLQQAPPPRTRALQQYMQDLQQEGQVLLVGAEGARWVLRAHAQPWLITINTSMWNQTSPEALPFIRHKHDIPFIRKRRFTSRGSNQETQAKRAALDTCRDRAEEESEKKGTEEEQLEKGAGEERLEKGAGEERLEKGAGEERLEKGAGEERLEKGAGEERLEKGAGEERLEKGAEEERLEKGAGEERLEKGAEEEREKKAEKAQRRRRRTMQSCTNPCCVSDVPAGASPGDCVSFVARPWRMVDGKLNRLMCKGMLEALLYHIMSAPGLTLDALLQHYSDVLQPQATLELLQALLDLGCVKKRTLLKRSKASLFSRPALPAQTGTADLRPPYSGKVWSTALEQPDTVYYEPTLSCVLRLSQVLPHERHWNSEAP